MSTIRFDSDLSVSAAFWTPEQPDDVTTGELRSTAGRVSFLASPKFVRLDQDGLRDAFLASGKTESPKEVGTLVGKTKEGNCTLFYISHVEDRGVLDFPSSSSLSAHTWRVGVAVMGLHIESPTAETIDGASFYFSKIHRWLPVSWGMATSDGEMVYTAPHQALEIFRFSSLALEAEIICEVFTLGSSKPRKKTVLSSKPRIRVIPNRPRSVQWFLDLGPRLENFFTLQLGSSVSLRALALYQSEKEGFAIARRRTKGEKVDFQNFVTISGNVTAIALARWLATPPEDLPLERTLLGMVRVSNLFVETEFLSLAQSLEAFGRLHFRTELMPKSDFKTGLHQIRLYIETIFGSNVLSQRCCEAIAFVNEGSFKQNLENIYALLSLNLANSLLGERDVFTQRVIQTRNFYTHLGSRAGKAVVKNPKQLFLLNQRLHALLRCVMLLKLGVPESATFTAIKHQAEKWS